MFRSPQLNLQKTPLTVTACKITQEIWDGMSLLSPFLPFGSPEKAFSSDIRSSSETVVSIWQLEIFSSLVVAVLQNHFWSQARAQRRPYTAASAKQFTEKAILLAFCVQENLPKPCQGNKFA